MYINFVHLNCVVIYVTVQINIFRLFLSLSAATGPRCGAKTTGSTGGR